jgi:D-galactose 1-dehydrogenase
VLDAGINAISILTKIIPGDIAVAAARLEIPANCECPIAAAVMFRTDQGAVIDSEFDFRHTGEQNRSIHLDTDAGTFSLTRNAAEFDIDGSPVAFPSQEQEYVVLYRRFAQLVAERRSDTDRRPLELVLDIFRQAERVTTAPFEE